MPVKMCIRCGTRQASMVVREDNGAWVAVRVPFIRNLCAACAQVIAARRNQERSRHV